MDCPCRGDKRSVDAGIGTFAARGMPKRAILLLLLLPRGIPTRGGVWIEHVADHVLEGDRGRMCSTIAELVLLLVALKDELVLRRLLHGEGMLLVALLVLQLLSPLSLLELIRRERVKAAAAAIPPATVDALSVRGRPIGPTTAIIGAPTVAVAVAAATVTLPVSPRLALPLSVL